ncbi:DUF2294 domain-containing protein [Brevibacillus sp. LEMMJ03]|uniref:DUF2294 domain-containing protein n=1 Tax=Brevibacillus sp. LEMMJ03 TaxID=2595056 RepID=UPI0005D104DA|nr:DUF2294 domain-containing protein [Brevibacillus sp. LEMMJ03]TRY23608.1 DUF2294 domain-containing protein [Brevibacillus sp. LEMMJ03]
MTRRVEHEFSMLVREIRKEYVGSGPQQIRTRFVGPWAITEMKGNLTDVEKWMIDSNEGRRMIHETRTKMVKDIYKHAEVVEKLETLVNAKLVTLFADINLESDVAITVFVFDRDIQSGARWSAGSSASRRTSAGCP